MALPCPSQGKSSPLKHPIVAKPENDKKSDDTKAGRHIGNSVYRVETFEERLNISIMKIGNLAKLLHTSRSQLSNVRLHAYTCSAPAVWLRRDQVNLDRGSSPSHQVRVLQVLRGGSVVRMPFTSVTLQNEENAIPKLIESGSSAWFIFGVRSGQKHATTIRCLQYWARNHISATDTFNVAIVQYFPNDCYDVLHKSTLPHSRAPHFGIPMSCYRQEMDPSDVMEIIDTLSVSPCFTSVCHLIVHIHSKQSGDRFTWVLLTSHPTLAKSVSALFSIVYANAFENRVAHSRHTFTTLLSTTLQASPKNFLVCIDATRRRETARILSFLEKNFHVTPLEYPLNLYVTARIVHCMRQWSKRCKTVKIAITREPEKLMFTDMPLSFVVSLCFPSGVTAHHNISSHDDIFVNEIHRFKLHQGICKVTLRPIVTPGTHIIHVKWRNIEIQSIPFTVSIRPPAAVAVPTLVIEKEPPDSIEVIEYFDFTVAAHAMDGCRVECACYGPLATMNGIVQREIRNGEATFTFRIGAVGIFQLAVRYTDIRLPPSYTRPINVTTAQQLPVKVEIVTTPPLFAICAEAPTSVSVSVEVNHGQCTNSQYGEAVIGRGRVDVYSCDMHTGMLPVGSGTLEDGIGIVYNLMLAESYGHEVFLTVLCTGDAHLSSGERIPFRCTEVTKPFVVAARHNDMELRVTSRPHHSIRLGHGFNVEVEIQGDPECIPASCVMYARIESACVSFCAQGGFISTLLERGRGYLCDVRIPSVGCFDIGLRVPLPNGSSLMGVVTKVDISDNAPLRMLQFDQMWNRLELHCEEQFAYVEVELDIANLKHQFIYLQTLERVHRLKVFSEVETEQSKIEKAYQVLQSAADVHFEHRRQLSNCQCQISLQPHAANIINKSFKVVCVLTRNEQPHEVLKFAEGVADICPANPLKGLALQQQIGGNSRVALTNGTATFEIFVRSLGRMRMQLRIYPTNCPTEILPFTVLTDPFEVVPPPKKIEPAVIVPPSVISPSETRDQKHSIGMAAHKAIQRIRLAESVGRQHSLSPFAAVTSFVNALSESKPSTVSDSDARRFISKFPKVLCLNRHFTFSVEIIHARSLKAYEEKGNARLHLLRTSSSEGCFLDPSAFTIANPTAELADGFLTWHDITILRPGIYCFRIEYHVNHNVLSHMTDPFTVRLPVVTLSAKEHHDDIARNQVFSLDVQVYLDGLPSDVILHDAVITLADVQVFNGALWTKTLLGSVIENHTANFKMSAETGVFLVRLQIVSAGSFMLSFLCNVPEIGEAVLTREVTVLDFDLPIVSPYAERRGTALHREALFDRLLHTPIGKVRSQKKSGPALLALGTHPLASERVLTSNRVALYPRSVGVRPVERSLDPNFV